MRVKYGLPERVLFCKRCVISNQRPSSVSEYANVGQDKPTIHFDEEGICDACRVAESKRLVDWEKREQELRELCNHFRSKRGNYDCVVPGSGGKDSFFTAHTLKHRYGMHPYTITWAPHIYTDWGWRNFTRWAAICGNTLHTPCLATHRLLTRLSLENLFHPFQPFIIGQKALPPKMAAQFGISLVFYGENEAEYGDPKANAGSPCRNRSYHSGDDIFLSGVSGDDLRDKYGLLGADIEPYRPATAEQLEAVGVEVRYLGYYLRWHPQSAYYYSVEYGQFEAAPERTPGTYSKYNSIDDKLDDLHYWTTFVKFGIGRATYDAAQEIRSGDITRDEGVALVRRFDGEYPERWERDVFDYLSVDGFPEMTRERLFMLADKFRSPHLWTNDKLRYRVWD